MHEQMKSVVSVAEMARMCGLSRQRFYQLLGSTFPYPLYDIATRRPFYPQDLQQVCLEVRRRNFGINGKAVMFYSMGHRTVTVKPKPKTPKKKPRQHIHLLDGLAALGLPVSERQVTEAVKQLYPSGLNGKEEGVVLKQVFLFIRSQECGHKFKL